MTESAEKQLCAIAIGELFAADFMDTERAVGSGCNNIDKPSQDERAGDSTVDAAPRKDLHDVFSPNIDKPSSDNSVTTLSC